MPLGQTNQSNNKPFFLRIRTTDKDKKPIVPEFSVQGKDGDKYVELPSVKKVTGDLVSIKIAKRKVTTLAGVQEVDDVKLVLEDLQNAEVYFVDARPSQLGRNLYNSVLNLTSGDNVSISLYQTKSKKDGKIYPSISVWQHDNMVKGKYTNEEIPNPEEVKNKKGEVLQRDFSEMNEWFFEKLKGLVPSFNGVSAESTKSAPAKKTPKAKSAPKAVEPEVELNAEESPDTELVTEDIPF